MRPLSLAVLTAVLALFLASPPVLAQGSQASGAWAWLQLDTDLAEQILAEGNPSGAGQLALDTHQALSLAADAILSARGQSYVDQLHRDLSQVLLASGFHVPVAPGDPADGLTQVGRRLLGP